MEINTLATFARPKGAKDKRKRKSRGTLLKAALAGGLLLGTTSAGITAYLNRKIIRDVLKMSPKNRDRKEYLKQLAQALALTAGLGGVAGLVTTPRAIRKLEKSGIRDTRKNRVVNAILSGALPGAVYGAFEGSPDRGVPNWGKIGKYAVIGGGIGAASSLGTRLLAQRIAGDRSEKKRPLGLGYRRRTGLLN
jgi:hypothetical protein